MLEIRKANLDDVNCFFNMLCSLDKETTYMMFEPDEKPHNPAMAEGMIKQSTLGNSLVLVATDGHEIVGFLSAQRGSPRRIRHTAYIVVGIREAFRGQGIGKEFFTQLDSWAKENELKRLELTVMVPNIIAKSLYEKNGFKVEGIKAKAMFVDGQFVDEYYMGKTY